MLHIVSAFKNSCNGLRFAWSDDRSFRNTTCQAIAGSIFAAGFIVYYHESLLLWLLLTGSLFPMVIIETVNCSIEAVTDRASPNQHPLAQKAKDVGSAAVLLSRVFALMCWIVVMKVHYSTV